MPATTLRAVDRDTLEDQTRQQLRYAQTCDPGERARVHAQVAEAHLWLADALARRFRRASEDPEDLQQVARTGLVQAVHRYDPEHGPFAAFATPTITGVLKRHFRDHGWLVRPPRRTQELSAQMRQRWPDLTQRLRGVPSVSQVAESLGASVDAVREAASANQGYRSEPLDLMGPRLAGADGGPDEISDCESRMLLTRVWRQLTADERQLLVLRFFEERSQSDIAARIGTSQMQVSRLLARTLRRLRALIGEPDQLEVA